MLLFSFSSSLLIHEKYLSLNSRQKENLGSENATTFDIGERIASGNIESKLIEGYATVSDVKRITVAEMKQHNDKHLANDFINKRWKEKVWYMCF